MSNSTVTRFFIFKFFPTLSNFCEKKSDNPILLVVGADVMLNDIVLTNALTLVGRFSGRKASVASVNKWDGEIWKGFVFQPLEVFLLLCGWLSFKFIFAAKDSFVLDGSWRLDGDGLSLKHWTPLFDPQTERYDVVPTWVKLPNLPFEFWSLDFLS